MKNNKNNADSSKAFYYMALMAPGLTDKRINNFSGEFEQHKQSFLSLFKAKELYEQNASSLCQFALQETGVTALRQTTEAYLLLIKPEHRQEIMQKLFYVSVCDGHEDTARLLLENEVDLGTIENSLTFLEIACSCNHSGIINLLLEQTGGLSTYPDDKKFINKGKNDNTCMLQ